MGDEKDVFNISEENFEISKELYDYLGGGFRYNQIAIDYKDHVKVNTFGDILLVLMLSKLKSKDI